MTQILEFQLKFLTTYLLHPQLLSSGNDLCFNQYTSYTYLNTFVYFREPLTTKEQEAPLPDYTVMVQEAIYGKLSVNRLNCNTTQ